MWGQPLATVPRVPTEISLLVVISLGKLLENALGSPEAFRALEQTGLLRKPSGTVTCWAQLSVRAGWEWFGRLWLLFGDGEQELQPLGDAWILKEKAAECGEMGPGLCWEGVEGSWWWPHPCREGGTALCAV